MTPGPSDPSQASDAALAATDDDSGSEAANETTARPWFTPGVRGIGLATHELPSLGRLAPPAELPTPTVFSVEPGVYRDGQTGVRIEDLVLFDAAGHRLERLTGFGRDVTIVG